MIKESIIDIPRRTYATGVFDDADTSNPKLKPVVLKMIKDQIKEFEKYHPVSKYSLIGSILTKRYRNDADLDINVLFDVPEKDRESARVALAKNLRSINGKLIPGTKHPINYYVITDPELKDKNDAMADAIFDVEANKFIRRPKEQSFDSEKYTAEFQKKVSEIDVVKGELKRDIIDYEELRELQPDDILDLQDKINSKLDEIEDSLKTLIDIGDKVIKDRQDAFNNDMGPEEIRMFGQKHKLPKNVIYKMLEKYHYLKFYKKCKDILDDGKVTDDEIDDLKNESIASKFDTLIRKTIKAPRIKKGLELYLKYLQQGVKDAKNKAAQHMGLGYREFGLAVRDAGLPEEVELQEFRQGKRMAFTFGRFNPPTIGHEKLIKKVLAQRANDHRIYLSRSQDRKKNPLEPGYKLRVMKQMFPQYSRKIEIIPTNMVMDLASKLYKQGYENITMVVGSDRVQEFSTILKKYNGIKSRHGYYLFGDIDVVSAGDRDPDADGAVGMSASKMRDAAAKGDKESFKKGLPSNYRGISDVERLMGNVRVGMGLPSMIKSAKIYEETGEKVMTLKEFEQQQVRDLYIREQIFNVNEKAYNKKTEVTGTVVRRGTNYIVIEDDQSNLHKSWIWDCLPVSADKEAAVREHDLNIDYGFTAVSEISEMDKSPQDKTVGKKPGTQPKKYYKDLSKGEKEKRADFFRKQKYKKSDDEDDYKAAPGDKDAKTKPSKHTLKYKKMFGELKKELVNMTNKEAYEIGADYANHTKDITPGEKPDAPPVDAKLRGYPKDNRKPHPGPSDEKITKEDIDSWATSSETIDKYKERYGDEWKSKVNEDKIKMMSFKDYVKF